MGLVQAAADSTPGVRAIVEFIRAAAGVGAALFGALPASLLLGGHGTARLHPRMLLVGALTRGREENHVALSRLI